MAKKSNIRSIRFSSVIQKALGEIPGLNLIKEGKQISSITMNETFILTNTKASNKCYNCNHNRKYQHKNNSNIQNGMMNIGFTEHFDKRTILWHIKNLQL